MLRELRREIEHRFADYCFLLGPNELMINPGLADLARKVEQELFGKINWPSTKVKDSFHDFFNAVSPSKRFRPKQIRLEAKIEELLVSINNIENDLVA